MNNKDSTLKFRVPTLTFPSSSLLSYTPTPTFSWTQYIFPQGRAQVNNFFTTQAVALMSRFLPMPDTIGHDVTDLPSVTQPVAHTTPSLLSTSSSSSSSAQSEYSTKSSSSSSSPPADVSITNKFAAAQHSPADERRCLRLKEQAIKESRKVRYLARALDRAGCLITLDELVSCVVCPFPATGVFSTKQDGTFQIRMCQNHVKSFSLFETVLTHEMIHAFDVCRAKVNFDNLDHRTCMEIRAANLSGDCTFMSELSRGKLGFRGQHNVCVRRRAKLSVVGNGSLFTPASVDASLDRVWDRCITDLEPFGSVP